MTPELRETEDRLRRALESRAASVEPAPVDVAALERRAVAAARHGVRRNATWVLGVAAAAVVVFAGFLALGGDDTKDIALTTNQTIPTTVTGSTGVPVPDGPPIWPAEGFAGAPVFATPEAAADSFAREFLGFAGACVSRAQDATNPEPLPPGAASARVGIAPDGDCAEGATMFALLRERTPGEWIVTGAVSNRFTTDIVAVGTTRATVTPRLGGILRIETRLLGAIAPLFSAEADGVAGPTGDVDITDAPPPPTVAVIVVFHGGSASATVVNPDQYTQPTLPPDQPPDDGVQGWPGDVSRAFDDPEAAALAFVTEVLDFDQPTRTGEITESDFATLVSYHPRPTASITTTIEVHDTGARGWVVVGTTSDSGFFDNLERDDVVTDGQTVTGEALAFEAHVNVSVHALDGEVLTETFTMAGGTEQLPFTFDLDLTGIASGTPVWVQIAEGDASGEGRFTWAASVFVTVA